MTNIVILGGGLTGLVAAERLDADGLSATVLERESVPGGACRSLRRGAYTFDFTGHLLHVSQEESKRYLEDLGVWSRFAVHDRRAAIHLGGAITPYPIQIHTWGLPPHIRRDCLLGFIRAWAVEERKGSTNFRDWVLGRFGEGLGEHFFFPYNEKLYRARPEDLSLDWVGRYVPKPGLEEVVNGALGLHDEAVGYNAVFRYPSEGGIEALPTAVASRVQDLRLKSEVVGLDLARRRAQVAGGDDLEWDRLVITLPLPDAVDLIRDDLSAEVVSARQALRWVRVVNLAFGVRGAAPVDHHWLYFPESKWPFYRVGFPSNHGAVAPEGCHTVSVEVSLDPVGGDIPAIADRAEPALASLGLLDRNSVEERMVTVLDPAYVVFDHARREAVATLRSFFRSHGILLAGRWAEWKYSAMEDAILDGMSVARRLTTSPGA